MLTQDVKTKFLAEGLEAWGDEKTLRIKDLWRNTAYGKPYERLWMFERPEQYDDVFVQNLIGLYNTERLSTVDRAIWVGPEDRKPQ